jgi:phosphopantetheinyl transferase
MKWLKRWWIVRNIEAAEWEEMYWQSGVVSARERATEYRRKAQASRRRAMLLRQLYTEVDHPIRHLKSLMKGKA